MKIIEREISQAQVDALVQTALRRCWPACLRRGACNRRRS